MVSKYISHNGIENRSLNGLFINEVDVQIGHALNPMY